MKPSLQRRMLVTVIMGMTVVLILFDAVLYVTIRSGLLGQIKANLSTTAELLAASVEINRRGFDLEMALEQLPDFHDPHQPLFFQISDAQGQIVAKSPNLGSSGIDLPSPESNTPVLVNGLVHGHPAHALTLQFTPRKEGPRERLESEPIQIKPYTLVVARESGTFFGQLRRLRWLMTLVSAIALILSVAMAWMVVRQGLRPLHTVAGQIAAISATELSTRVQVDRVPRELSPIAERLNDLLDHLQETFEHERRFTADVAHELRTPLAGLRSVLDVSLSRSREATAYHDALVECSSIATAMQTMVENLLTLARLEARSLSLQCKRVSLLDLVDRCWLTFTQEAQRKSVTFTSTVDPTCLLHSDPDYLAMILTNLFSNAVEYTPPGGQITVTATQEQESLQFTVANTGCTLTSVELEHVFDRFWRADTSRSATGLHCGLGLALVHRMAEALSARVTAKVADGLFIVQITGLPCPVSE